MCLTVLLYIFSPSESDVIEPEFKRAIYEPQHVISNKAAFCHVDSHEPVQPPFKLSNSK